MSSRGKHSAAAHAAGRGLALLALLLALGTAPAGAAPQDIVLMLDNSGSMRRNDPDFLTRLAVRTFLDGLDGDNRVAIVAFDQNVRVLMPLTPLDADSRARFLNSLDAIDYAGALTNSPAALERSLYELRVSGRPGAERSIIFMTDGIVDVAPEGADAGDVEKARWMKSTLADEAADGGVRIFGIAFTDNADFELIQTLAKRTSGEYYRAYTAADIDEVFAGVREHLAGEAGNARDRGIPATSTPAPSTRNPTRAREPDTSRPPRPPALPAGTPALGDDRTPRPAQAPSTPAQTGLPLAGLPRATIPQSELPEVELPQVELPPLTLARRPPAGSDGATTAAATAAAPPLSAPPDPVAGKETTAPPRAAASTPSSPPAPAPAPATPDDGSRVMFALAAGAAALVFALAALVIVVLRRRDAPAVPATDALMPKALLNDINGATAHKNYELAARPVIVGRLSGPESEAADYVVIDESTVGRRHALIEYKEHSFWVTDQNSLNGTFVNNARIEDPTRLKHGDRIRFHRHEFEFLVIDMFETDRTMMSETVFADLSQATDGPGDEDATVVRDVDAAARPSAEDPTITRT